MKKQLTLIIGTAVISWILHGCTYTRVETQVYGHPESPARILFATRDTPFKNEVLKYLKKDMIAKGYQLHVVDLKNLGSLLLDKYQVILIANEYTGWRYSPEVVDFLEGTGPDIRKKIILFTTAGAPEDVPEQPELDAVSGASDTQEAENVSKILLEKVEAKIRE